MAADPPNASAITVRVLIPTRCAASLFAAVASTAFPSKVSSRKAYSRVTMTAVPPSTQKLCGWIAAPNKSTGASPVKAGSLWNCLSKTICATPRNRIDAPIVMMIKVTADAPRAGSIASQYSSRPTTTAMQIAISAASGRGTPAADANTVTIPPSITNSPWAKFTTSDAL